MKIKRPLTVIGIVAFVVLSIIGCTSKTPNSINVTQTIAENPVTAYGKIIDRQTRKGIAGATVSIKVNGEWRSTGTASDSSTDPNSTAGDFSFSSLPLGLTLPVVVKTPQGGTTAYVTVVTSKYTGDPDNFMTNNQVSTDWGQIEMEQGMTVTVRLVNANTGAFVAKTDGSAIAIYVNPSGDMSTLDILATQDATDLNKYTVTIPQTGSTTLFVPAVDVNGDGIYDYESNSKTIDITDGVATTIELTPISDSTTLSLIARSYKVVGAGSGGDTQNVMGKNDSLSFFFNIPVQMVSSGTGTGNTAARMTYTDNFKSLTAAAVTAEVDLTASLSADNTILTFTPSAALTEVQTYVTNFDSVTLSTTDNTGAVTVSSLGTLSGNPTLHVFATGAGSIGNSPSITLDNYNHCTNGAAIVAGDPIAGCATGGSAGNTWLVAPEPIWGTVALVTHTIGATTTNDFAAPVALTGQNSNTCYSVELASNDANLGFNSCNAFNRTGAVYFYALSPTGLPAMLDDVAATPSKAQLEINAYDAEGNTYTADQSYSVQ